MSSLKILHTADVHLGTHFPFLGPYAEKRAHDFFTTFQKIVEVALKTPVDLVLIAGDLFDTPHPTPHLLGQVKAEINRLIQYGIPVALIPGTHDNMMASDNVYLDPFFKKTVLFKDPVLQDPKHLKLQGKDIYLYGMSYHPDISVDYMNNLRRRDLNGFHIGLLHGSVKGSPDWKIYSKDFPISAEELFSLNLDYVALGHYHNPIIYRKGGLVKASYPGTPEGKRFHESGKRYVNLIELSQNGLELKPIAVNSKTLIEETLDLSKLPSDVDLQKEILKFSGDHILARITLTGVTEDLLHLEKIEAEASPYFSFLELSDETSSVDSQWIERLEQENSVRGYFVRKMKTKIKHLKTEQEQRIYREAFKEILSEFQKRQQV